MEFKINNIVTTKDSNAHKRIVEIIGAHVSVEWYTETGRQEYVYSESMLSFVSPVPTKQFLELKSLWIQGNKSFHESVSNRRERPIKTRQPFAFRTL